MRHDQAPASSLWATVEELAQQLTMLQQVHRRQRRWLVGCLLFMIAFVSLGAAVMIKGADFEVWPDAATGDPKSSHLVKLIGTTGAGVQRSMILQNKTIDGTTYSLDISADATGLLTVRSDGKVGVGTTGPLLVLDVAGQVKITGGAPGVGKVLTSDAAGLASWEASSGAGLLTTANTNTLAADTDANEADSKLYFEVDGLKRMIIDASGKVGIGTTTPQYQLDVRGTIGNDTTEHHGADYAEWFEKDAEEALGPGDIVGLNPRTLKVRRYQPGDPYIGVYSTSPGAVGNRDHHKTEAQLRKTHALVGLLGQLPFDKAQAVIEGGIVWTKDGRRIGLLLPGSKVLIVRSSGGGRLRNNR